MVKEDTIFIQEGDNPFDYQSLQTIADSPKSKVEKVLDDEGNVICRKTKKNVVKDPQLQRLEKRGADFLIHTDHKRFPKGFGHVYGHIDGDWVAATAREWIDGSSLEDIVTKGGSLPLSKATSFASQIVEGLSYVHEKGFVFRDLKPSNVIVEDDSVTSKYKFGQIKFTDVDTLGYNQEGTQIGGKTIGIGTHGWTNPMQFTPGMNDAKHDFFAVGTSLYFMVMKDQARMALDEDGGFTLHQDDLSKFEEKVNDTEGGPELYRTLRKLVSPKKEFQYGDANEVLVDLENIEEVFDLGYHSNELKRFRVHQESLLTKGVRLANYIGDSVVKIAKNTFVAAGVVGTLLGAPTMTVTSDYLAKKSAERIVYDQVKINEGAHPLVVAAANVSNASNGINEIYVKLNMPNAPNAIVLLEETEAVIEASKQGLVAIGASAKILEPYRGDINTIITGSKTIRESFKHSKRDNETYECHPVTSYDQNGDPVTSEECGWEYDDTDHWWKFDQSKASLGLAQLDNGIFGLINNSPEYVLTTPFQSTEVVGKEDILGREIKDAKIYLAGRDEWVEDGFVAVQNRLSNPEGITQNSAYVTYKADARQGFPNNLYKDDHTVNTCSSCDERGAPKGYIRTKAVSQMTSNYTDNYRVLFDRLNRSAKEFKNLEQELGKVVEKINSGKQITEKDYRKAADISVDLYKSMVPNATITAPSSTTRAALPIGLGFLAFLAGAVPVGYAMEQQKRRRRRWNSSW